MQSSSESSLWRSLAIAFGDGLAFGAGVKLMHAAGQRNAQPRPTAPPAADPALVTNRADKDMERGRADARIVDRKVLEVIVNAVEVRLNEHSRQMERHAADLNAKIEETAGSDRDIEETVARLVAEQVSIQVEERLRHMIPAAIDAAIESRLPAAMSALIEPLERRFHAEVEQRDREIAELRRHLAETDTNVRELILGIGRLCRQAAGRASVPAPAAGERIASAPPEPQIEDRSASHRDSPSVGPNSRKMNGVRALRWSLNS